MFTFAPRWFALLLTVSLAPWSAVAAEPSHAELHLAEAQPKAQPQAARALPLAIQDGWVRAVPPVSRATAAYLTLHNQSSKDDILLHVTSAAAKAVELHTVVAQPDGSRAMQRVAHIAVPAGKQVALAPGGYHIMLIDLTKPLRPGDTVELALIFQHAGKLDVKLPVAGAAPGSDGAAAEEEADPHAHHHHHH